MTRAIQKAVPGIVLAAMLALGAPGAYAASGGGTTGSEQRPVASAWTPPEGFVREASFSGMDAACEKAGRNGIADGKWSAYICVRVLPFSPFVDLYVKK
ncbi:hypothetical protein [Streptomyces djakartensis]|uniref:Uncharacterized protein n=1 Tax=Streptomyces djakartensis TaxID=68193 RepID=A0ABQ2ZPR3_9ACTN|nr:hypothetical protein [Streptomyces djakartensis]GGY22067.1 hypothetical protein GCM10010384_30940 [Streptomyces djakartensis]